MSDNAPVAVVTGAAQRIGAEISTQLHRAGYRLAIHYRQSAAAAEALADTLNTARPESAATFAADLAMASDCADFAAAVLDHFGGIDLLVNNASLYFRTPVKDAAANDWSQLLDTNVRAPWLLCRAFADSLAGRDGSIVNIIDAHAQRATPGYAIYDMSKLALESLTRTLARELAPRVRVNGVAPGMILWPETRDKPMTESEKSDLLRAIPLGRLGEPADIAASVLFLAQDAPYITGQVLAVDGGRNLA